MIKILESFKVGEKVRICGQQGFEIGVTGTISYPPKHSLFKEDFGDKYYRKTQTLKGEKISVWITFDEPQYDNDNDGPYSEAAIITDYLEIVKK